MNHILYQKLIIINSWLTYCVKQVTGPAQVFVRKDCLISTKGGKHQNIYEQIDLTASRGCLQGNIIVNHTLTPPH